MKIKLALTTTGIVSLCFCLFAFVAMADSRESPSSNLGQLNLVVRPWATIKNIPLEKLCPNKKIKNNSTLELSMELESSSKNFISGQIVGSDPFLVLRTKDAEQQIQVQIKRKKENICNFGIFITRPEWLEYANSHLEEYGKTLIASSLDWLLIQPTIENKYFNDESDKAEIQSFASAASPSDNGTTSSNTDFEYGSGTIYTRGICARPFDPTRYTRYGSGIIVWANNPGPTGFSVKDENNSSGYVSAMRCPKGPYQTEYSVDGAYRIGWGPFAYKVPDHCTATRVVINGRAGWNCCCNSAFLAAGYGTCSYINGQSFPDWPDAPKTTCR